MTEIEPQFRPVPDRRRYRNPPIEEALCEIRFAADEDDWDPTIPGLIYATLKDEYPAKPVSQGMLEAGVRIGPADAGPQLQLRQNANRVQLRTKDEKSIVSIGPSVLSVHRLRPYTQWEDLRSRVWRALRAYREVAEPSAVVRLGMRYINRIEVVADVVELPDYFTSPPRPPESMPQEIRNFITRVEAVYDDADWLKIMTTFTSTDAPEGRSAFILDVDLVAEPDPALSVDDVMKVLEDMRNRERTAFESLITNKAREIFDAE